MSATSSAPPSSVPSPSSPSAAKRAVQLLVSIAIGAGMLWFAFRDLPVSAEAQADGVVTFGERLSALYDLIKGIPVGVHLGYFALVVVQFVMRSLRWKLQAEGVSGEKVAVTKALAINAVAFAAVFLFPFRLGEFVRPVLSQRYNIMTASAGLANSAVERILDGLVTSICFAVVLISLGDTALPGYVQNAGILAFAAFGGIALSLVLAVVWRDPSIRFWRFVLGNIHETLADKLVGMLIAFLDGLRCFRTFAAFAAYLGLTVGYWLINGAAMWFLLTGMGLTANGAGWGESPSALSMNGGSLALDDVLKELGTGLYISNLWYLNFSDRTAGRITGMTRFATFWVEDGQIKAPVSTMRFDDSIFSLLGDSLEQLTAQRELILSTSTYSQRQTASNLLPGALISRLTLTL